MIKILHIADVHVKHYKLQKEQRIVFQKLYEYAKEHKPDWIFLVGDLFHVKGPASAESIQLVSELLLKCASVSRVLVTLGNHDCLMNNAGRLDNITPVVNALQHPNIVFQKYSGEVELKDGYTACVLSILDKEEWSPPSNPNNVNILLNHGAVRGMTTDLGHVLQHGDIDLSWLTHFDYGMLGDLHKADQWVDDDGRVRYSGSLTQTNFGEDDDKGFLWWEINDKNSFEAKHVHIPNPKPFVTVYLTKKGRIPKNTSVPPHARLRLVSDGGVTVDRLRRATEIAKTKFKPESVTFLNRSVAKNALEGISGQGFTENLRDSAVQEKLFKDYLHEYDLSEEELDRIISLNSYYNSKVDDDGVSRNISWRVIRVEWDNLFSYDHGNFVNYDKLAGVVGILGANYSGKSSAVAALLVAMFNSTSKNIRKSVNYINQNKDTARAKVALEVDGKIYTIERTLEKYVRRLHGAETIEARTDVNFTMYDPVTEKTKSMNGESRIDTDKNIRKIFGTMEDFLISSMSAQMDSTAFIDEGPTKRSEIMAKFLDLSPFAQKFKMAKEDASDLKADIKRFGGIDFDHDLEETKRERRDNARGLETIKSMLNEAKEAYEKNREGYINLENRIDSFEEVAINIHEVRLRLGTKNEKLSSLRKSREENDDLRTKEREMLDKIDVFLGEQFDVSAHQEDKRLIEKQLEALSILENNIQIYETEKSNEEVKTRLLKQVPCGPEFSSCQFIRDAYEAKAKIVELEKTVAQLDKEKESFDSDLEARKDTIDRYIKKHSDLQSRRTSLNESLLKKDTFDINMKMQISDIESEIAGLEEDVRVYEANRQMYSEIEELEDERDRMSSALAIEKADISRMESSLAELYTENGSFGRKIEQITTQKQEYERMQKEYSAYDLFMRCCHSKGISLEIIKRNLPAINQEIANILSNVVKFEIFLKNEEKRLEIYIKHPKYGPRPIETGSGSEKTIAAAAIRIALLNVSSLPKSNCFIMDEPGTELDPEHLENFTQILDLVKSSFDVVILISHIDALRDVVDQQIAIEKREGYAHIEM